MVGRIQSKEILGIWMEQTEGAKFWLRVMNELKNRGAQDILIAVVDGLKGFPEAINATFPQTIVQTRVVHQPHAQRKYDRRKLRPQKKNPKQFTHLGCGSLLPELGFFSGAA